MYGVYSLDSLPIYFDIIELNYYILIIINFNFTCLCLIEYSILLGYVLFVGNLELKLILYVLFVGNLELKLILFVIKFHVHGMQNLFVITLKENKYKAYQVNRSILFYGFSRPIEFDKFYFYGLTSVSFLVYVSNRIIMNHFLSDLTTFSLFKNYT